MKFFAFAFVVSLVFAGCGGKSSSKAPVSGAVPPPQLAQGLPASVRVFYSGANGFSATERSVVKTAADWMYDAWVKDNPGRAAPSVASLEITSDAQVATGETSENFGGGNVKAVAGPRRDVVGLYREMHHLALEAETGSQDRGRTDPRWSGWLAAEKAASDGLLTWRRNNGALGPTQ